jgi:hypothetical protein
MVIYYLVTDLLSRLRWAAWDVWKGIRERYPACCIGLFAVGTACGVDNHAIRRGAWNSRMGARAAPPHRLHHGYEASSWDGWDPDEVYDDELKELWS